MKNKILEKLLNCFAITPDAVEKQVEMTDD